MKKLKVYHLSSIENTMLKKQKINPYAVGHGVHKSKKYPNRSSRKKQLIKEIRNNNY